jgi:hypothetical protein
MQSSKTRFLANEIILLYTLNGLISQAARHTMATSALLKGSCSAN